MTIERIQALLPEGGGLPADVWDRRHKGFVALLWLNALGLAFFGIIQGYGALHVLGLANPVKWAVIHGVFLLGASIAGLTVWKQNERLRASYQEAARQLAEAETRQRDALDLNDNVLQNLAVAEYSFELGMVDKGRTALKRSMAETQKIVSELVATSMPDVAPGDLVRSERRSLPETTR